MTTRITKRSPQGKTDKGWWIVTGYCTSWPVYWGQLAKTGNFGDSSTGFDTKKEAKEFAMEEGLLDRQYDADGWEM